MIYISKFGKNICPLFLSPLPEEVFSSWLHRLAANHRINPEALITDSMDKKISIKINSLDITPAPNIINQITKNTPLKTKEIEELFLTNFSSNILEENIPEEIMDSIYFLKFKDSKTKKNGIVYCPSCLSKGIPYFRKKWRLSTTIICHECNCYLMDFCPNCYNPVSYWNSNKNSIQINSLITMCKCGYDISKYSSQLYPSKLEIEYQNYVDLTIMNGYNKHTQYSFTYLTTLMYTASMIKKTLKSAKYKRKLNKIYPNIIINTGVPSNKWSLSDRQHLLPIAYYLLKNFPNNIKSVFPKKYTPNKEFGQLPYWFEKELHFR